MCLFYVVICLAVAFVCVFFFFKQKTAYEMRISDWSSDVCSSDLERDPRIALSVESDEVGSTGLQEYLVLQGMARVEPGGAPELLQELAREIGRASCRERVCQNV